MTFTKGQKLLILIEACHLVTEGWCQHNSIEDKDGNALSVRHDGAAKHSLFGAIAKAVHNNGVPGDRSLVLGIGVFLTIFRPLLKEMIASCPEFVSSGQPTYIDFNDNKLTTQKDVIAFLRICLDKVLGDEL